jgi:hypothetical protein
MGVLVEALSVVVPVAVLDDKYAGGLSQYECDAPNATFCTDGYLTRIGFMSPHDVRAHIDSLKTRGLEFQKDAHFVHIAVVDQVQGPTAPCAWLRCGKHSLGFGVAWLLGTSPSPMSAPSTWVLGQSQKLMLVRNEEVPNRMIRLSRQGMFDVLLDYTTGKEVYVARTT